MKIRILGLSLMSFLLVTVAFSGMHVLAKGKSASKWRVAFPSKLVLAEETEATASALMKTCENRTPLGDKGWYKRAEIILDLKRIGNELHATISLECTATEKFLMALTGDIDLQDAGFPYVLFEGRAFLTHENRLVLMMPKLREDTPFFGNYTDASKLVVRIQSQERGFIGYMSVGMDKPAGPRYFTSSFSAQLFDNGSREIKSWSRVGALSL
ncbi:MAG: hypothetical protein V1798_09110 [Pseudomonadota bacterium]